MSTVLFPTRRDEAWRYADLDALARVWPLPPQDRIVVPAGKSFSRVILPKARDEVAVEQLSLVLGKGARADLHVLVAGSAYGRVATDVTLAEGAHFELGGAIVGAGRQTLEIVTTVTHAEPGATSHQVIRSVLAGQATGSFLGRIAVARDAQRTDAEQSIKAMLLDRTATANAKPELEIYADDVKCAHGATVGELDKAALFYLASRGLPPAEARRLLLQAFIAGVFDGVAEAEAAALDALGDLL